LRRQHAAPFDVHDDGQPANGSPHVVTVRTPDARLVWYRATVARTAKKIAQLGVFDAWRGILVRDDYAGWYEFDAHLAGVQQCCSNHPGLILARRLKTKADQVWLFTTNPKVPWTNNASEQALKSPKLHQKVSGYWHTTITLARYCRVRSYLVSARNHGVRLSTPSTPPCPADPDFRHPQPADSYSTKPMVEYEHAPTADDAADKVGPARPA
jgi:hypothetical protein